MQQKVTLPIKNSHRYTDLTVAAEVFNHDMISQHQLQANENLMETGMRSHSSQDSSHSHSSQDFLHSPSSQDSSHSHSSRDSFKSNGANNYSEIDYIG